MGKTQQQKRFHKCDGGYAFAINIDLSEVKVRKRFAKSGAAFKSAKDKERKPKYKQDYSEHMED